MAQNTNHGRAGTGLSENLVITGPEGFFVKLMSVSTAAGMDRLGEDGFLSRLEQSLLGDFGLDVSDDGDRDLVATTMELASMVCDRYGAGLSACL